MNIPRFAAALFLTAVLNCSGFAASSIAPPDAMRAAWEAESGQQWPAFLADLRVKVDKRDEKGLRPMMEGWHGCNVRTGQKADQVTCAQTEWDGDNGQGWKDLELTLTEGALSDLSWTNPSSTPDYALPRILLLSLGRNRSHTARFWWRAQTKQWSFIGFSRNDVNGGIETSVSGGPAAVLPMALPSGTVEAAETIFRLPLEEASLPGWVRLTIARVEDGSAHAVLEIRNDAGAVALSKSWDVLNATLKPSKLRTGGKTWFELALETDCSGSGNWCGTETTFIRVADKKLVTLRVHDPKDSVDKDLSLTTGGAVDWRYDDLDRSHSLVSVIGNYVPNGQISLHHYWCQVDPCVTTVRDQRGSWNAEEPFPSFDLFDRPGQPSRAATDDKKR